MKADRPPYLPHLFAASLFLALSGCGGSSSDSTDTKTTDTTETTTKSLTITAVDPYISGAEFYIDLNSNGQYDAATDKLSTAGDNRGEYTFENYTPASDVTETDVLSDPVDGLLDKPIADLTTNDIAKIRTQVILTGLQRIMQGSTEIQKLTDTQFIASATQGQTTENIIYHILDGLVTAVISGVKQSNIDGFLNDSGYQTVLSYGGPTIKTEQFLNVAITILNRITEAGYTACNTYNDNLTGNWDGAANVKAIQDAITPLVSQIGSWGGDLGPRYYAVTFQNTIANLTGGAQIISSMSNDANLKAGFDCASKYFEINTSNNIVCVSQ